MTDLTKMSVPSLLAMCDECNYPGITDELARRLAAAEATIAQMVGELEHTQFIPNDSEAAAALSGAIERALAARQPAPKGERDE